MTGQFTRWLCPKCGGDGIDSWNKAVFDGTDFPVDEVPNPWVIGAECCRCLWPVVLSYSGPEDAPRAIFGPRNEGYGCYAYEAAAFVEIERSGAGQVLAPSDRIDADWSGGCLAAKGQMQ